MVNFKSMGTILPWFAVIIILTSDCLVHCEPTNELNSDLPILETVESSIELGPLNNEVIYDASTGTLEGNSSSLTSSVPLTISNGKTADIDNNLVSTSSASSVGLEIGLSVRCTKEEIWDDELRRCLPRGLIGDACLSSKQCFAPGSTCTSGICVCRDNFFPFNRHQCLPINGTGIDYGQPVWCPDNCCKENEIYVEEEQKCLKKGLIRDDCLSPKQCIVPESTCSRGECLCVDYYIDYTRTKCTPIHNTAIEIYKITMIFASSCLALILLIFLACILRKSYCPADPSHHSSGRSTINDLFTIYPGTSGSPNELFLNISPTEKPPSYSETMRMINQEIGTPPPSYQNIFYTETSTQQSASSIGTTTTTNNNNNNNNYPNVNNDSSTTTTTTATHQMSPVNGSVLLPPNSLTAHSSSSTSPSSSSSLSTTINAQNRNLYSLSQSRPSGPLMGALDQGQVNSAFANDS